jgi:hypothetical protein
MEEPTVSARYSDIYNYSCLLFPIKSKYFIAEKKFSITKRQACSEDLSDYISLAFIVTYRPFVLGTRQRQ